MTASRSTHDHVLRVGAVVLAVGALATLVTMAPLFLDADPLPLGFYLLSMLMPVGLGIVLVGLWRNARANARRVRDAVTGQR